MVVGICHSKVRFTMENIVYKRVNELHPDPNQPRKTFDKKKLKEMAESIKEKGILYPLLITKDNMILDGERRWKAAKLAGLEEVPCLIRDVISETERSTDQLIADFHTDLVTPLERGRAVRRLLNKYGRASDDEEEIRKVAKELGTSTTYIHALLRPLKDKRIEDAIEAGKVDFWIAEQTIQFVGEEEGKEIIHQMAKLPKEQHLKVHGEEGIRALGAALKKVPKPMRKSLIGEFLKGAIRIGDINEIGSTADVAKVSGRSEEETKQLIEDTITELKEVEKDAKAVREQRMKLSKAIASKECSEEEIRILSAQEKVLKSLEDLAKKAYWAINIPVIFKMAPKDRKNAILLVQKVINICAERLEKLTSGE